MSKIFACLAAAAVLVGASAAQVGYTSTIGLNITDNGYNYDMGLQPGYSTYSGSGPVVTTVVYPQSNWYQIDGGAQEPIVNRVTTGIKYDNGTALATPLTFNLVTWGGTQGGVDLNGDNYSDPSPGTIGVGEVTSFSIAGIPYANYDVAVMVGCYWKDVAWEKLTGGNGTIDRSTTEGQINFTGQASGSTFTFTGNGSTAVYAIQILETQSVPEPGTFALLGAGLIGLLGYAWRRRRA